MTNYTDMTLEEAQEHEMKIYSFWTDLSGWIPTKDKLPPVHRYFLLYIPNVKDCVEFAVGYLENDGNFYFNQIECCIDSDLVTHYMPLPSAPQ